MTTSKYPTVITQTDPNSTKPSILHTPEMRRGTTQLDLYHEAPYQNRENTALFTIMHTTVYIGIIFSSELPLLT